MCWEAGLDPLVTMRIVGHEDYHTTASIYTHLKNEHLKRAKQEISVVFKNKKLHKSCTSPFITNAGQKKNP